MTSRYQGSLSIRPSYGARGEEILDGGGGRGRRETPDTQAITKVALFLGDNKTNDDGDGKENGKKMFILTNNNFARESHNFVHFFAIVTPLGQGVLQLKRRDKLRRLQQKYLQRPPSLYTNGAQTLES